MSTLIPRVNYNLDSNIIIVALLGNLAFQEFKGFIGKWTKFPKKNLKHRQIFLLHIEILTCFLPPSLAILSFGTGFHNYNEAWMKIKILEFDSINQNGNGLIFPCIYFLWLLVEVGSCIPCIGMIGQAGGYARRVCRKCDLAQMFKYQ